MTTQVTREEFNNLYRDVHGNGQAGIKQLLARVVAYVERQEGIEFERARSRSRRHWILGISIPVLTASLGWGVIQFFGWVGPPAAAIIREYYANHPDAQVQHSVLGPYTVHAKTSPRSADGINNFYPSEIGRPPINDLFNPVQ